MHVEEGAQSNIEKGIQVISNMRNRRVQVSTWLEEFFDLVKEHMLRSWYATWSRNMDSNPARGGRDLEDFDFGQGVEDEGFQQWSMSFMFGFT